VSEVMDKDSETARSVSKAFGRFGGRDLFDEESAQDLILALSRVGRLKKESFWICEFIFCIYSHVSTILTIGLESRGKMDTHRNTSI